MSGALWLQAVLLVVPCDGRPLRFGAPLPVEALDDGLALRTTAARQSSAGLQDPAALQASAALQWRPLPVAPTSDGRQWVELAIAAGALGSDGCVRVLRGGAGPCEEGRGPAFARSTVERVVTGGRERVTTWRWCDGVVDERRRRLFDARTTLDGEVFFGGEAWTVDSAGLGERARHWLDGRAAAVDAGLLPRPGGGGRAARAVRDHLGEVVAGLQELPGLRGAGDFARGDGVVTNLEFDTTFALLRQAVGSGDRRAFGLAVRAARHLVDRDLDGRSGLPFVHGRGHRVSPPQSGHVWLRGLVWTGLLTADDELVHAARSIGRALAASPPAGSGRDDRLRDYAWPLLELEHLIVFSPEPELCAAADRLAASILARFDPGTCTFRFGEGEREDASYLERAWLTGGLLLPALRAHLGRRPDDAAREVVRRVERSLLERAGQWRGGFATHYRLAAGGRGQPFAVHRERGTVRTAFLLDGFDDRELRRLLRRGDVQRAFAEVPPLDDPDLATSFTLLARCDWVWR